MRGAIPILDRKKNRIVVYTAIAGNYDRLKPPLFLSDNCDYVCFSDNPDLKSDVWQIKPFDGYQTDDVRKCRRVKILPHLYFEEYEYSIWIDANIVMKCDANTLIQKYLKDDTFTAFIHPDRNCIFDEAEECIRLNRDSRRIIEKQMALYRSENYPAHHGLIASGVILRKHNDPRVKSVMEQWWAQVAQYSKRDQLSFNFIAWKNDFKFAMINQSIWKNDYFEYRPHDLGCREKLAEIDMGKYDFGYTVYDGSTVQWALRTIRQGSTVLEFGPYNGNLTKHLKEQSGCKVDIVEIDEEAGRKASEFAENALIGPREGNIENYDWCEKFKGKKYDYIVFLDVLEHLYGTEKILSAVKDFLAEDGSVLLSIPNVAHNSIILNLIKNEFQYTPLGLLDNTHIRFFTYRSILRLAKKLDYSIQMDALQLAVGNNEIASSYQDVSKAVANYLKQRPYADVYQYLVQLKKQGGSEDRVDLKIHNFDNQKQLVVYVKEAQDGGFLEEKTVRFTIEPSSVDLTVDLAPFPDLKDIRIDPMECPCVLTEVQIALDGSPLNPSEIICVHGKKFQNGKYFFTDNDPQIFLGGKLSGTKKLQFRCDVERYDDPFIQTEYGLLAEMESLEAEIAGLRADLDRSGREKKDLTAELDSLQEEFDAVSVIKEEQDSTLYDIYNSRAWKAVSRYRNLRDKLRRK